MNKIEIEKNIQIFIKKYKKKKKIWNSKKNIIKYKSAETFSRTLIFLSVYNWSTDTLIKC